jgi:hypothetical protein
MATLQTEMAASQEMTQEEIRAEIERVLSQFQGLKNFSNRKNFHSHIFDM